MNKLKYLAFAPFLVMLGLLFSCENEVDINDDYEEISIVYALLDQSQTRHFVKFTKAFQTDGNVYLASNDATNSQYLPSELEIWMDEFSNGNYIRTIYLDTVLITNKEDGAFYFPNQLVYATPEGTLLNPDNEYKFKAKVKSTGNVVESSTFLVKDFSIVKPSSIVKTLNFSGNYSQSVQWRSAANGKLHELKIRFFYTDVPVSGPTTSHYVDWIFPQVRAQKTLGGETMDIEFVGSSFYGVLGNSIPAATNGLKRYSDSLQYIFSVADENFTIYMDVNKPSNSIVQERPAFSNIGNGLGIFASRYQKVRSFAGLTAPSLDSLYTGIYTSDLGFTDRP
jgi:hypothetical protein